MARLSIKILPLREKSLITPVGNLALILINNQRKTKTGGQQWLGCAFPCPSNKKYHLFVLAKQFIVE